MRCTPLHWGSLKQQSECVRELLKKSNINTNITDEEGKTLLILSAESGHVECLHLLLSHPSLDINTQDSDGRTALHAAAENGHAECIRILLKEKTINITIKDNNGRTAYDIAKETFADDEEMLSLLQTDND